MQVIQNQNVLSTDKGCENHLFNAFRWNEWSVAQVTKLPRPSQWPRVWYGQLAAMWNSSFPGSPVLSSKDKSCKWLPTVETLNKTDGVVFKVRINSAPAKSTTSMWSASATLIRLFKAHRCLSLSSLALIYFVVFFSLWILIRCNWT